MKKPTRPVLYHRIREILDSAHAGAARSVNTAHLAANWLIGCEIVEAEQKGRKRATYGEELLKDLSARLSTDVGKGWSVRNLEYCRAFYFEYPLLLNDQKSNAVRSISSNHRLHQSSPHFERSAFGILAARSASLFPRSAEGESNVLMSLQQPKAEHVNLLWTVTAKITSLSCSQRRPVSGNSLSLR